MMKKINSAVRSAMVISILLMSVGSLTWSCNGSKNRMKENNWYSSGEWLNGLQLKPHASTNQQEFEKLYKANPNLWSKAFEWLKVTDLEAIAPGTYVIEEDNLKAIITDAPAPEIEQLKWEVHQSFSDIQYIVRGKALMGVALASEAVVTKAYDSASDVGFVDAEGEYYTTEPGTFFIFTPEDAHHPGIKVEGFDTIRKVIIKVRAKEE